jgi:hypothetical protein
LIYICPPTPPPQCCTECCTGASGPGRGPFASRRGSRLHRRGNHFRRAAGEPRRPPARRHGVGSAPSTTTVETEVGKLARIIRIYIYRTRAAAGIGGACGLGASPTPDPRGRLRTRKYRRAARLGCNGAQWSPGVRQQQPRALLEDTGLQSRPTTDGPTETPTTDAHACANGPIFHLCPGPVQSPQSSNYELDRPVTSLPWWRSAAALAAARYTHVSGRVRLINSCPLAFCKLHPPTRPQEDFCSRILLPAL